MCSRKISKEIVNWRFKLNQTENCDRRKQKELRELKEKKLLEKALKEGYYESYSRQFFIHQVCAECCSRRE